MPVAENRRFPNMAKLTTKQLLALPILASGATGVECSKLVGVKASTVSEWVNHCPTFVAELDRLREQVTKESLGQLQASVAMAVGEVRRIITKGESEAVRLKAAEFVISNCAPTKTKATTADGNTLGGRVNLALILEGLGVGSVQ